MRRKRIIKRFCDINFYNFREGLFCLGIILIAALALFKYVQYPEPYTFSTDCNDGRIRINESLVSQPIVLNDKSDWSRDACVSIYFDYKEQPSSGYVEISLIQDGKKLSSVRIDGASIPIGFYDIKGIDYSMLSMDKLAKIEVGGVNLDQNVCLGLSENIYNLPECEINGTGMGSILAQKYHFHFENIEHTMRIAMYAVFIIVNLFAVAFLLKFDEQKWLCRLMQVCIIISFIASAFIYDCKLLLFPIYNDIPFNYVHDAISYGFFKNLVATDAGYLPIIQRLFTILVFKVLHIKSYYAVYIMQLAAYVLSGYFFSFILKTQYRGVMPLKWRYVLCLLCSMFFSGFQQVFYNAIYLGIIVILCMFLTDSNLWSRKEYIALCIFSMLICLSKGAYVTVLPLMVVFIILNYHRIGRRERFFIFSCSAGCLTQLLYYFLYGTGTSYGVAVHWTSRAIAWGDMGGKAILITFAKLLYSVFLDVPNRILSILGAAVTQFNGIGFLLIAGFWITIFLLLWKEVFVKWIKKEEVDIDYARFFLLLSYIAIHDLFLRITIHGVSDIKKDTLFTFQFRGASDKYSVSIMVAVICLFFCCAHILSRKYGYGIKRMCVPIVAFCLMFSNSQLQLYGIGNEQFCDGRVYADGSLGEPVLLKGIEDAECRTVPIMGEAFLYSRNAKTYCFGENIFNWKAEYGNLVSEPIEMVDDGKDLSTGILRLTDMPTINNDCKIWQVYVSRTSLLNNKKYEIVIKDDEGNRILSMEQDNSPNQLITSFTFFKPLDHVGSFQIRDVDGNSVRIKNGFYLVTSKGSNLFI